MKISFYEEFPTKRNLGMLRLISFDTEVFVAVKSLKEFFETKRLIRRINSLVGINYWPILEKDEGYWMSPFSDFNAMRRIIEELKNEKRNIKVVWDNELPFLRKSLFVRNLPSFNRSKNLIESFLRRSSSYNKEVLINENVLMESSWLGRVSGTTLDPMIFPNKKIFMYYTSMLRVERVKEVFLQRIKAQRAVLKDRMLVGVGCLAVGIRGDEPILKAAELDRDLKTLKAIGVKEVIIYRLGGLNRAYLKVVEDYLT